MRRPGLGAVIYMAVWLLAGGGVSGGEWVEPQLTAANSLRHQGKHTQAVDTYEAFLKSGKASRNEMIEAHQALIECHRALKQTDQAIAVARRLTDKVSEDRALVAELLRLQADLLWASGRREDALRQLGEFDERLGDEPGTCATAASKAGEWLLSMKEYGRSYDQSMRAATLALADTDPNRAMSAWWQAAEAAWAAGDYARCLQPLREAVKAEYAVTYPGVARNARNRLGECLLKLQKPAEARDAWRTFARDEPEPAHRISWRRQIAASHTATKEYRDAIAALEEVFRDRPEETAGPAWQGVLNEIIELHRSNGDLDAALANARLAFEVAEERAVIAQAAGVLARLMKEKDGNTKRAAAFIAYQNYGPAGKDKQLGTADDPVNPIGTVAYPDAPQRRQALTDAMRRAPNNGRGWLARGYLYEYSANRTEAAGAFRQACLRGDSTVFSQAVTAWVCAVMRATQGHPHGIERNLRFVAFGPAGPDGVAGNADDLADPFADVLTPTVAKDEVLERLRPRLQAIVDDAGFSAATRRDAALSLAQTCEAGGRWDADGLADWYLRQLEQRLDGETSQALMTGALAAVRGGRMHCARLRPILSPDKPGGSELRNIHGDARRIAQEFAHWLRATGSASSFVVTLNVP